MTNYSGANEAASTTEHFPIEQLVLDDRCQSRALEELDRDVLEEYRAAYEADAPIPPIAVFEVDEKPYVIDGFHRVTAAIAAGRAFLRAIVVGKGEIDDAIWNAMAMNQRHGLRRSREDKRRAIRRALETEVGIEQSSRAIAKHVGVDHKTVEGVRKEVEASLGKSSPEKRVGLDGKWYPRKQVASDAPCEPKPPESHDRGSENRAPETAEPMPEGNETRVEVAAIIQSARKKITSVLGTKVQSIDEPLRRLWREVDNQVAIVCEECGGAGCKWCEHRGWFTKQQAATVRERIRSLQKAKGRA